MSFKLKKVISFLLLMSLTIGMVPISIPSYADISDVLSYDWGTGITASLSTTDSDRI